MKTDLRLFFTPILIIILLLIFVGQSYWILYLIPSILLFYILIKGIYFMFHNKIITIKKGKHYSFSFPSFDIMNEVSGFVKFVGDFEYNINKQGDTNKLIGLSDGFHHHQNSIRIGWRWDHKFDCIEVMSIVYNNGKREMSHLGYAFSDLNYFYKIKIHKYSYQVEFDTNKKEYYRTTKWNFIRYKLMPYFGGTTKSPKNFKFKFD